MNPEGSIVGSGLATYVAEDRSKGKPKIKTKLAGLKRARFGWFARSSPDKPGYLGNVDLAAGRQEEPSSKIEINITEVVQPEEQEAVRAGEHWQRDSCRQSGLLCNVDQVKRNFIGLLRYNKLQDFYLGTIAYSVIMAAIVLHSSRLLFGEQAQRGPVCVGGAKLPAGSEGESDIEFPKVSVHFISGQRSRLANGSDLAQASGAKVSSSLASGGEELKVELILLSSMLSLSFILILLAARLSRQRNKLAGPSLEELPAEGGTTGVAHSACGSLAAIEEAKLDADSAPEAGGGSARCGLLGRAGERGLQSAGLLMIILTLYLPSLLLGWASQRWLLEAQQQRRAGWWFQAKFPQVASLALAYFQPLLLEGSPLRVGLICGLSLLPLAAAPALELYLLLVATKGFPDAQLGAILSGSSICLPVVFLFGLLRRSKFKRSVTENTFAGASQLIEAKVSLEHQRQQQETLLLSVLPAYVADQVKRNMLKKMTTAPGSGQPGASVAGSAGHEEADQSLHVAAHLSGSGHLQANYSEGSLEAVTKQRQSFLGSSVASGPKCSAGSGQLNNGTPTSNLQSSRRGFNELYIRTYNNVSLLYGDIVGFTRLCTQLSSSQLVRVLNDLFSLFDHLAEKHKIMRIKILGDCYYGVSGIPEFAVMGAKSRNVSRNDNHAINCVNMGLDMIHYIKCLNVERSSFSQAAHVELLAAGSLSPNPAQPVNSPGQQPDSGALCKLNSAQPSGSASPLPAFELNMRIGIHTGHIHSGVIGLKKWQFDVWSNDVSIAMHCESSGTAGRVQVTEATIQQLNGAFSFEEAPGSQRDPFFVERDIKTFLIRDRVLKSPTKEPAEERPGRPRLAQPQTSNSARKKQQASRKRQLQLNRADRPESCAESVQRAMSAASSGLDEDKIRAATIGTIRQTLLSAGNEEVDEQQQRVVCYGLAFNHQDLEPVSLEFRDHKIGRLYKYRPIEDMLPEVASLFLLFVLLLGTLDFLLLLDQTNTALLIILLILVGLLLAALLLVKQSESKEALVQRSLSEHANQNLWITTPLGEHEQHLMNTSSSYKHFQVITDKTSSASPAADWLRKRFEQLRRSLKERRRRTIKHLSRNNSRTKFKTITSISVYCAVILMQIYLIYTKFYKQNSFQELHQRDNDVMAIEQYQLTVMILLISIDSSVNLLSYKAKSSLIIVIIVLHFLFIFRSSILGQLDLDRAPLCNRTSQSEEHGERKSEAGESRRLLDCSSGLLILLTCFWSLSFARQMEYTNKVNFLWRNRLNVDHEELEYISGVNKILLENILPSHVVQYYLSHPNEQPKTAGQSQQQQHGYMRMSFSNIRSLRSSSNELYHEQHDNVAVMFASIPHFYEFYDESNISKQGLGCIALLNEIICDFDKLLLKNKFSRIEKIKTIGSTYMAAAGLRPCHLSGSRNSTSSQHNLTGASGRLAAAESSAKARGSQLSSGALSQTSSLHINMLLAANSDTSGALVDERRLMMSQQKMNLICMVQFASSLMNALNVINRNSFQGFKLRVGLNTGPVIAGVIGAQRPFYDIWGDCVNIASRMETLGETGRIQVERRTAQLLMESLCTESYSIVRRGPIDVKGKGEMVTYFVDKKPTPADQWTQRQPANGKKRSLSSHKRHSLDHTNTGHPADRCRQAGKLAADQ